MSYTNSPLIVHRGQRFQQGAGIGGIFKNLIKYVVPIAKSVIKMFSKGAVKAVKSPVTKSIAKKLLKQAKRGAIDTGVGLASSVVAGDNVKERFDADVSKARKRLGKAITTSHESSKKNTKVKKGRKRKSVSFNLPTRKKSKNFFEQDLE